jgi:hypothetical protein
LKPSLATKVARQGEKPFHRSSNRTIKQPGAPTLAGIANKQRHPLLSISPISLPQKIAPCPLDSTREKILSQS